MAKPPVPVPPVGVGRDSKGGVCVYGFSWVPFCADVPCLSECFSIRDPCQWLLDCNPTLPPLA